MRPTQSDYDRYIWLVQQGRECKWNEDWLKKNSSFKVADPAMHFILLRANKDLRLIGLNLGEDISEIDSWISALEKGVSKLWNYSLASYDSFDLINKSFAGSISSASFMCWYAGVYDKRMLLHYDRIMNKVKYGMPSYDPESEKFDRKRYWRGPRGYYEHAYWFWSTGSRGGRTRKPPTSTNESGYFRKWICGVF